MSNSLIIDVTAALKNCDREYPLNFNIELTDILPYAQSSIDNCSFCGHCVFTDPDIEIFGKISLQFSALCDRCGTAFCSNFEIDFDQIFYRQPQDDQYGYSKNKVEVGKAVVDEILLSIPSTVLCKQNCHGVCLHCGTNLNSGSCICEKTN